MIQVEALPALSDNYIWLLKEPELRHCAVVDPGDAAPVLDWLKQNPGWQLTDILVTHHHHDHTDGVIPLKAITLARILGPQYEQVPACDLAVQDHQQVQVLGVDFQILHIPGHTLGHIAYFQPAQALLFCGDTLFAGGCGRLFEGTFEQMHSSLQRLAELPKETLVYCTHEYTLSNLRFARVVEPDNPQIQARFAEVQQWRELGKISLPSNIGLERATNPFLRVNEISVKTMAEQHSGQKIRTPLEVFTAIRRWKDQF